MRSKIFRQVVQINQGKADALPRFFGQADGIIFKQAVRLELCGVALIIGFRRDFIIQLPKIFVNKHKLFLAVNTDFKKFSFSVG